MSARTWVMPIIVRPGERTLATAVPRATSVETPLHWSTASGESFCESAASPPLEVTRWAALWRKTSSPRASAAKDDAR